MNMKTANERLYSISKRCLKVIKDNKEKARYFKQMDREKERRVISSIVGSFI